MCVARVRSLRMYTNLGSRGVNYFSITVRREYYLTWEVHLGMVCISSGAYKVNVYLYF
jgi:hypothetical protein